MNCAWENAEISVIFHQFCGSFNHFSSFLRKFLSFAASFCCFLEEKKFLANKRCLEACIQGSNFSSNLVIKILFVCDILWKYQPAGWQKANTYIILLHIATKCLIIFIIEFLITIKREICMLVKVGVTHNKT